MARAVIGVAGTVWALAALGAAVVAAVGVDRLLAALPPLAIDADAVRGATVGLALALGGAAAIHGAVLVALRRGHRLGWTAAVLLSGIGVATFVALAGSAFASSAREPSLALPLALAGVASLVVGAAYALASAGFVREIRSRSRTGWRG